MSDRDNFAQISIAQDGREWSAMLLDDRTVEVLRGDHAVKPGPAAVRFVYSDVSVVAAVEAVIATESTLGQRVSFYPGDDGFWAHCLETTKSNKLDMAELIRNTRPGVGGKPASVASAPRFLAKNWPKLATMVLAVIVGVLTYERFFFGSSAQASVATDEVFVNASGAGRVIFTTAQNQVQTGEPVAGIARSRSRDLAFESPCDCLVSRRLVSKGSWVGKSDPLIALSPLDGRRFIRASFPASDVPQLLRGEKLTLKFQDGSVSKIAVPSKDIIETAKSIEAGLVQIDLDPGRNLPASLIGEQVEISYPILPTVFSNLIDNLGRSK